MPAGAATRSRIEAVLVFISAITGAVFMAVVSVASLPILLAQRLFLDHPH